MKKVVSLMLAIAVLAMAFPALAITNDRATAYCKILDGLDSREIYGAGSYLIDFDGDGNEELFICWESNWSVPYSGAKGYHKDWNYEVYSGSTLLGSGVYDTYYNFDIETKRGESGRKYFVRRGPRTDFNEIITFTVIDGAWVQEGYYKYWEDYSDDGSGAEILVNGEAATKAQYHQEIEKYESVIALERNSSIKKQVLDSFNLTISGYDDIYPKLTAEEKDLIFEDFLNDIAYELSFVSGEFNTQTATDEELVYLLANVCMDTDFPNLNWEYAAEEDFTALTQRYFGRTIDYSRFEINHEPTYADVGYNSVYYNGRFRLMAPQRGSDVEFETDMGKDIHLYSLGNDSYYASFKLVHHDTYSPGIYGAYGAIIKKNNDGTYRLVRIGMPMTVAEIEATVNPSDWAKAEITSAEAAGLIPELDSAPVWTDKATRIQFAQLAVSLAEKVTGKEITAASASTFKDCSDTAVLKAFKAGIINGTSESEFSPYASLTREQLATMIWRTVDYIQKETKKEKLSGGGSLAGYTDAGAVSDYAKEAVAALAKNDIMKGTSETELSPKGNCTVEQSVILMHRVYNRMK